MSRPQVCSAEAWLPRRKESEDESRPHALDRGPGRLPDARGCWRIDGLRGSLRYGGDCSSGESGAEGGRNDAGGFRPETFPAKEKPIRPLAGATEIGRAHV